MKFLGISGVSAHRWIDINTESNRDPKKNENESRGSWNYPALRCVQLNPVYGRLFQISHQTLSVQRVSNSLMQRLPLKQQNQRALNDCCPPAYASTGLMNLIFLV